MDIRAEKKKKNYLHFFLCMVDLFSISLPRELIDFVSHLRIIPSLRLGLLALFDLNMATLRSSAQS